MIRTYRNTSRIEYTSIFRQIEYLKPKLIYNNIKFKYGNLKHYCNFLIFRSKVNDIKIKVDQKVNLARTNVYILQASSLDRSLERF